jgi:hypothetical protein
MNENFLLKKDLLLSENVLQEIKNCIYLHHQIYDIKVSGELWENILHKSFVKCNLNSVWNSNSHRIGTDIIVEGVNVSCKSGSYIGKKVKKLVISSHRTTKLKTIEEKKKFLDSPHEDVILSLVEENNKYKLFVYNKPLISNLQWIEESGGWSAIDDKTGNSFKISRKMSDQFWMYLNMNNWNIWGYTIHDL